MNFKHIFKTISSPLVNKYQAWRHQKTVVYGYKSKVVNVLPGVFSPSMYSSTSLFLDYISTLDLQQKTVLELGCGAGIISVVSANKGALVTASDINETAINELTILARDEILNVIVVYSDLFENLHFHFDYIFINPPIIPKDAVSIVDKATYAGANFEFFDNLFSQLKLRSLIESVVLISLPSEADYFAITRKAKYHHLQFERVQRLNKRFDEVVVYRVVAAIK